MSTQAYATQDVMGGISNLWNLAKRQSRSYMNVLGVSDSFLDEMKFTAKGRPEPAFVVPIQDATFSIRPISTNGGRYGEIVKDYQPLGGYYGKLVTHLQPHMIQGHSDIRWGRLLYDTHDPERSSSDCEKKYPNVFELRMAELNRDRLEREGKFDEWLQYVQDSYICERTLVGPSQPRSYEHGIVVLDKGIHEELLAALRSTRELTLIEDGNYITIRKPIVPFLRLHDYFAFSPHARMTRKYVPLINEIRHNKRSAMQRIKDELSIDGEKGRSSLEEVLPHSLELPNGLTIEDIQELGIPYK